MFGTLGAPELFLIFVVALIVFGPKKLPEIGKSLGTMLREFRKASSDFRSTLEEEVAAERAPRVEPKLPAAAVETAAGVGAEPAAHDGDRGAIAGQSEIESKFEELAAKTTAAQAS